MKRKIALLLVLTLISSLVPTVFSSVGMPLSYQWDSVPIGAGGFVTGIAVHPNEPNVVYVRTDVGGAYRWSEQNETWTALCDAFPRSKSSFYGIDGIALDANNADVVYIAAGAGLGADFEVLKSTDRGDHWTETGLAAAVKAAFPGRTCGFDGNGANRGMGERIAVDPINSDVVYVGVINAGLWKTVDGGASWSQVFLPSSFPMEGNQSQEIRSICFDVTANDGRDVTQSIYIGVTNHGMYHTSDGGVTWQQVEGAPNTPMRMSMAEDTNMLYVASKNGLFRYADGTFTEISPNSQGVGTKTGQRFNGVSVNPLNGNEIVCAGPHVNNDVSVWYSANGGATWTKKMPGSGQVESTLPWNQNPGFNSNGHCIIADWNGQADGGGLRVWTSDWFCAWRTEDIRKQNFTWRYLYQGIEEMVPRDIATLPQGPRIITAVADNQGFVHYDPSEYPDETEHIDWTLDWNADDLGLMSISDVDFCAARPQYVAAVGVNWNMYGKMQVSTDYGTNWRSVRNIPSYVDSTGKVLKDGQGKSRKIQYGKVAVSADVHPATGKPVIVAVPAYNPVGEERLPAGMSPSPRVSLDFGENWMMSNGPNDASGNPINLVTLHWNNYLPIAADRVIANNFYILYQQQVYISNDYGQNWTAGGKITDAWLSSAMAIKAVPDQAGHVWATMGNGLYRSKDAGQTFQKVEGISDVVAFGFGKAAPQHDYPAVYLYGSVNGVEGVYRSIDTAIQDDEWKDNLWQQINDMQHTFGCSPGILEGDMQQFGVVYLGSGGRGVFYGKPEDEQQALDGWETIPSDQYNPRVETMVHKGQLLDWSYYKNNRKTEDNEFKVSYGNGLILPNESSNWGGYRMCIYDGQTWEGNYTFSFRLKGEGGSPSNTIAALFQYVDQNNYYFLEAKGSSSATPSTFVLGRVLGGTRQTLDTYVGELIARNANDFEVHYDFGNITVKSNLSGTMTPILRAEDHSLRSGKIGVETLNNIGSINYIRVVQQEAVKTPLHLTECYLTDGQGNRISSLSQAAGTPVVLNAKVLRNFLFAGPTAALVVKVADANGMLKHVWLQDYPVPQPGSAVFELPIDLPADVQQTDQIVCYLWDSRDSLSPLYVSKTLEFE